ncbi:catalase family protein [Mycobacterium sp. IS-2888]|uniref:catalase family protein n=1 Tax=Mycobacterium sp. IS-2888 TaxID=1834159 RepID=UPI001588961A|nr:catalase family protein [Mycobacterium sp. IS-2888]
MSPPRTDVRRYPPPPGPQPTYVPYSDALEQPGPDEDREIDGIVKALHGNNEWAYKKFHHGLRDAHAKTLAVLRGELIVYPDLRPELAQGLFAQPRTYPVVTRLSTTSGVIRSDQIRGVHGLAIKVLLDEPGDRILADDDAKTQDFLLVTHREFPFADVRAYLRRGMPLAWLLARLSDPGLSAVGAALTRAKSILSRVGVAPPNAVEIFIEPNTHILGQNFYSSAPIRWGDNVAKFEIVPLSESVKTLAGQLLPADSGYDAYRSQVFDFFASNSAEFELRAQLCTDLARMPIEDATVPWPEEVSPHIGVAKLRYEQQNPDSPDRRRFGDDVLSYNSWRGLAAHRPLGPINRLKLKVYEASSNFRHDKNNVRPFEPTVADLPQ